MALSKISEIGGVIQGNWDEEYIITGICGAGSQKAGWAVSLTAAGVTAPTDNGVNEDFIGLLLLHYTIDMDTLITANLIVDVVVPKSGHLYGVFTGDLGASHPGITMLFCANAGLFDIQAALEGEHICRSHTYTSGDTVAVVIWGR